MRSPLAIFAIAAVALLAGCATGPRPTLVDAVTVNDAAVQTVLDRMVPAEEVAFTATYTITPTISDTSTEATVRQMDGRREITIGNVAFVIDGDVATTCRIETQECVDFVDDAAVSDLNVTHRFWGRSFADRLHVDANRNIGPAEGRLDTIAGQPAACADVPVVGGTVSYCALDAGVVGRYLGADVTIELTSFSTGG